MNSSDIKVGDCIRAKKDGIYSNKHDEILEITELDKSNLGVKFRSKVCSSGQMHYSWLAEYEKVDSLNQQPHYNRGKIEVIEFLEDQEMNFCLGNVLKYICRAGHKVGNDKTSDLRKALWYLEREIKNELKEI